MNLSFAYITAVATNLVPDQRKKKKLALDRIRVVGYIAYRLLDGH